MSKSDLIFPSLHFNAEKTAVTLVVVATKPLNEKEFIACLYDFMTEFGDGFKYEEVGQTVEFEMEIDEDYMGDRKH